MRFEFATAARILFGPGTLAEIEKLAPTFGRHALVVTGGDPARASRLLALLSSARVSVTLFAVAREPSTDDITRAVAAARTAGCDFVIGFGGGSAIDTAKAVAALLNNDGDLLDYLEVVGRAQPLTRPGVPCIAIPTTAGTGSEVTRNAVLSAPTAPAKSCGAGFPVRRSLGEGGMPATSRAASHEPRLKVSLRSPHLIPRVALVDPELTYDLPPAITASTGLDALTQLIEPCVSTRANPLTDALCVEGIRRAARSLYRAIENSRDPAAREDMSLASLFGGLALANAGLGAVHGLAGPLGGMFSAPHGALCAVLLAPVTAANLSALRARAPQSPSLARYDEIARLVTARPQATADDLVPWLHNLVAALGIPSLATYGIATADFPAIAAVAANASSMKANPLPLTANELVGILASAL